MFYNLSSFDEVLESFRRAGAMTHKIENITLNLVVTRFHKHIQFSKHELEGGKGILLSNDFVKKYFF